VCAKRVLGDARRIGSPAPALSHSVKLPGRIQLYLAGDWNDYPLQVPRASLRYFYDHVSLYAGACQLGPQPWIPIRLLVHQLRPCHIQITDAGNLRVWAAFSDYCVHLVKLLSRIQLHLAGAWNDYPHRYTVKAVAFSDDRVSLSNGAYQLGQQPRVCSTADGHQCGGVSPNVQAWRRAPLDLLVGEVGAQSLTPTPYLLCSVYHKSEAPTFSWRGTD